MRKSFTAKLVSAAAVGALAVCTLASAVSASDKVWVIATDTAFRPFEYTNAEGEFVGIDVDILAAIAEDQGFEYDLQSIGWDAGVAAVQVGQADGLIAGATINDERKEKGWIFSLTDIMTLHSPSSWRRTARSLPSKSWKAKTWL